MKKNLLPVVLILLFFVSAVKAQTFNSTPVTTALVGTQYTYTAFATDATNQPLTFTAPTLPAWLTFSASGQYTPVAFGSPTTNSIGGIASDAAGNVYAIDNYGTNITKIAPDGTTTILCTASTAFENYNGLLVIGNYLYITQYGYYGSSNDIKRVDLTNPSAGEQTYVTIPAANANYGLMGMVEKGGYIYCADYEDSKVIRIKESDLSVSDYITNVSYAFGLSFAPDGSLYIASYAGYVYKYDGTTLSTVFSGLSAVADVEFDANGYLYVDSQGAGIRKYVPNLSSYVTIATGYSNWGMNLLPGGTLVYGYGNQVYKVQAGATISGTPAIADIGVHNVKLSVTNGTTSTDQSFTISVSGPPTITNFPDLNSYAGASPITLTAPTSNSAGAFTYTSGNTAVATVSGNQITIVGPGTAIITATQAPNGLYITGTITATLTVANTVNPTLALGNISKTYGDAAFTLGATSNSSGAITYTSGNTAVATISGSTVTIVGQGTAVITANQAAAAGFNAFSTTATLTVAKKALSITASNQTKVYGAANPTLAVTYSGFVNSETSAVLTTQPTITTTAVTGSPVGTYPITATGAVASNYTITYTAGTLTVTPAGLNITASNQTKTYGAANPALGVTYSGFVGTDNAASLTTQPSVSTTATASSAAGTYPITATGAASANYTITYTAGTLTVNKAGLIITAANQTKVYGAALPALTVTYSGFVNGDTNTSALSTQAAISTTGTATSAVGTYPITATGAVSSNYTITYTAGTLTVTQAALNIAAINATKVYGSANPALAVTYSGFVNGDDATKLTTQPAITTTATASSAVGTYPITATGAVNPNYSITYTAATLTVTQAPLVITANNISRNYGQPNPTLTATYTGLVNGDTNISLTTQPTLSTTATITSLPGTYPITVSGAAGANYSISYVAGTFRVIPLTNANLSNLTISNGILSPAFATGTFSYTTSIANSISNVTVIPTSDPTATIVINGSPVNNGSPFAIDMAVGYNTISTIVTAQDGTTKLTYTITVYRAVPPDAVFATNILTPNGDGKNDTWTIKDILLYPNNTVKVFDRAGRIVFAQHSYANTWDGTLSGSPLTEGTYYYAIDLGIFGAQPIKGYISILRKR